MAQVGDKVWFKVDVEGYGQILEVEQCDNGFVKYEAYVIGQVGKRDCSPWHIMAQYDHMHNCNVVYCTQDQVFYNESNPD